METEKIDNYPESMLTSAVINAAIEVHKVLGPGLLESAYKSCMIRELREQNLSCLKEVALPVEYKGMRLDCGYRMDIVVESRLVLELKCVEKILPIHESQLLTYLKLSDNKVGLILNFNSPLMMHGIKRMVL